MHMTNTLYSNIIFVFISSNINYLKVSNNDNVHHLKTTLFSEGL